MKLKTLVSVGAMVAAVQAPSYAATIALDFSSLPSAQGWTYFSTGPLEADVYSVDGTKLIQNTLGTGFTAAEYRLPGLIDPTRPFTIDVRARVIESEAVPNPVGTGPASALLVGATSGTEMFVLGLNTTTIHAPYAMNVFAPLDGTQFHDYHIDANPGVSVSIFVDGTLLITRVPPAEFAPNALHLGNTSGFEKGHVEITSFVFSQPVPEPETYAMLIAGLGIMGVVARRRRSSMPSV